MSAQQLASWHDFFVMVGGGAAGLTGLAVVGMSLHLRWITSDPVLMHRARMMLAGLAGVFMRCALALMGDQTGRGVAIALFVVCLALVTMGVFSYAPVARQPTEHRSSFLRTIGSNACYGVEMLGAALLYLGFPRGLTFAAVAMVANFYFMIAGAWLLLVGIHRDESGQR